MNQENKNQNLFKKIQNFIFKNYIQLIISLVILLIIFIGFQTYNYFKIQDIKKSSISFFDIIQDNQNDLSNLKNLIEDDNIFSILSKLKLIKQNNKNKNFHGPFSSDSFFGLKMYKKFDGVISFYHDQGLTGFKAISFDHGVNYTAGLSIIRSSPDHGTAFNIAEKGIANEESLINSILLNIDIFNSRKLHK